VGRETLRSRLGGGCLEELRASCPGAEHAIGNELTVTTLPAKGRTSRRRWPSQILKTDHGSLLDDLREALQPCTRAVALRTSDGLVYSAAGTAAGRARGTRARRGFAAAAGALADSPSCQRGGTRERPGRARGGGSDPGRGRRAVSRVRMRGTRRAATRLRHKVGSAPG
jgi:hypothetical protein